MTMGFLDNITLGLSIALSYHNLLYCFLGVLLGMVIGVIPGIGVLASISMLFPITFYLDPTTALIMLAGIWYGSSYGGSTAAILLNIPGTPSNAVTALDGYPMARAGRGGVALFMTTIASFVGGSIGILVMTMFTPVIAPYALRFGSAEYFSLMVFGLVAASTISGGSVAKGLAMVVAGLMLGTIGADMYTGVPRFSFGFFELTESVSLVALAMGMFGISEVIATVRRIKPGDIDVDSVGLRAMLPTRDDWRRSWLPTLRGSGIGSFFGTLPATGPAVAAFMAYAVEKRSSSDPERFGKGAVEGIMAPEAANNSADQTAFIPTLSLGIPGSPTMALMLGALLVHGITPGPALLTESSDLFWGLVMSFWVGNLMLLILNIPLIGLWVRLLMLPYTWLYPAIIMFICIGTYTVNNSIFDIWLVLVFGFLGYVMRIFDWPAAPLLLGFVLGPLMENHFRRAMLLSRGDFATFVESPIAATSIILTVVALAWGLWSSHRNRKRRAAALQR